MSGGNSHGFGKGSPFAKLKAELLIQAANRPTQGHRAEKAKAEGKKSPSGVGGVFQRLAALYSAMQSAYEKTATEAGLSCKDCPQNCCHSYFRHHTFVEWSYLWRGLQELPEPRRKIILERAQVYATETELALAANAIPSVPCPLLEDGLCGLYSHRLMICRMHGTRNRLSRPDGQIQLFPGCFRFVERTKDNPEPPTLERTPFYQELAELEMELRHRKNFGGHRVNLTIAEMLLAGPPKA